MSYENEYLKYEERSRIVSIYWAGVFVWTGLVFGFDALFQLPSIGSATVWTWVVLGAGLFGTLINIFYSLSTETVNPRSSDWFWSGFWLIIGLSGIFTVDLFWPLVLVIVGTLALIGALRRR